MSSQLRTETIPANGQLISGPGNFFFMITASASVDVKMIGAGTSWGATGVSAGYLKANVQRWDRLVIAGAAGTVVTFFVGDEDVSEDVTDIRAQIALIGGVTLVSEAPSTAISSPAASVRATGGADTIAANLSRKRITVSSISTNTGSLYLQSVGAGAGRGLELQPGMSLEIKTTAAIDVRNDSGASQTYTIFEET